ncbi:prepilin-type N-terminal cleavage/methylation domain-containing protein [Pontiellaceae bacterium B12227]|nr:prepilin-type N-terminal cleavage/methylation domain-containing protein [Pontiellaceae bacterium B12227]
MKRGFTLIEIMLALLVLTIGIVSVVGVLSTALDTSAKAREDLDVVSFADMVLNHCHAMEDWNAIPTAGNLALTDYSENDLNLSINTIDRYTSRAFSLNGNAIEQYTVTYNLNIQQVGTIKTITLKVWPGYRSSGQPRIFQTEIYNWNKS